MTIGQRTKSASLTAAVVHNLGFDLIIGLEMMSTFRIVVDCEDKKINLKRNGRQRAIRESSDVTIPGRCQMAITGKVSTIGTIQVETSTSNLGFMTANSIDETQNNEISL